MWTVLVSTIVFTLNFIWNGKKSIHLIRNSIDFSCSFDCFKKHKNVDCVPAKTESQENGQDAGMRKPILQFTTEDTVDPEKLAQLGMPTGLFFISSFL